MTKVISVMNLKGGVGKTTTSLNLAHGLVKLGKKILVIDLDLQSNATAIALKEVWDSYTASNWLLNGDYSIKSVKNSFDIMGADTDLSELPKALDNLPAQKRYMIFKEQLKLLEEYNYDYIIVDCPPTLNSVIVSMIVASDLVIIPTECSLGAVTGANKIIANITKVNEHYNLNVLFKVLFTKVNRNGYHEAIIEQSKESGLPMFDTTINYQAKPVVEAEYNNKFVIDTKTRVGQNYKLLIFELLEYLGKER